MLGGTIQSIISKKIKCNTYVVDSFICGYVSRNNCMPNAALGKEGEQPRTNRVPPLVSWHFPSKRQALSTKPHSWFQNATNSIMCKAKCLVRGRTLQHTGIYIMVEKKQERGHPHARNAIAFARSCLLWLELHPFEWSLSNRQITYFLMTTMGPRQLYKDTAVLFVEEKVIIQVSIKSVHLRA